MNIQRIHIADFGMWHDRTIRLDAPITLLYGKNEAGKSTIHAFMRFMLFGFPPRASASEWYASPRSSLVGGTMTLADETGAAVRLERYVRLNDASGKRSDEKLHVAFPDGTSSHLQQVLSERLLGGMTADVHRNIFAFSLDELRELSALQSAEISGFLFSTGLGVAPGNILAAEKSLVQEMDRMYRPRGQNPTLNAALKQWSQTGQALREYQARAGQYNDLKARLEVNEAEIKKKEIERSMLHEKANWLARCMEAWGPWVKREEIIRELARHPDFSAFPVEALQRYEHMLEKTEEARMRYETLTSKLNALRDEMLAIRIDSRRLDQLDALRDATDRLAAYQSDVAALAALRHDAENIQEQLTRVLRQIDPAWTVAQLLRFPVSLAEQERARSLGDAERVARDELIALREEIRKTQMRAEELKLKAEKRSPLDRNGGQPSEKTDLTTAIRELSRHLEEAAQLEWQREQLAQSHSDPHAPTHAHARSGTPTRSKTHARSRGNVWYIASLAFGTAGLTALAVHLFMNERPLLGGLLIALAALIVAGSFVQHAARRKDAGATAYNVSRELDRNEAQWEQNIETLLRQLNEDIPELATSIGEEGGGSHSGFPGHRESASALEASGHTMGSRLRERARTTLEALRYEMALREARAQQGTEEKREYEELQATLIRLRNDEATLLDAHTQAKQAWTSWLSENDLPLHVTDRFLPQLFMLVDQAQQLHEQGERLFGRIERLHSSIVDYEQTVCALLELSTAENLELELRQAYRHAQQQAQFRERQVEVQEIIAQLESEAALLKDEIDRFQSQIDKLMAEANAETDEQFRRKAAHHEQCIALESERRQLDFIIEHLAGEYGVEQLSKTLQGQSEALLGEALALCRQEIAACEEQIKRLNELRGKLRNELERLQSDEEHADAMLKYEEQAAEVLHHVEQWAKRALALQLIRQTRETAERERQPFVMVKASEYMERMTGGKYRHVHAKIADRSITVERADGLPVPMEQLSRGTIEQLFLAIRFALAEEHAKQSSVPILMDDIFVNFDRERLYASLQVLYELARTHQIVLFTCHDHIRDAAKETIPELNVVELRS